MLFTLGAYNNLYRPKKSCNIVYYTENYKVENNRSRFGPGYIILSAKFNGTENYDLEASTGTDAGMCKTIIPGIDFSHIPAVRNDPRMRVTHLKQDSKRFLEYLNRTIMFQF